MSVSRRKSGVYPKGGPIVGAGGGGSGSMRPPPAPFSLRAMTPAAAPQTQAPTQTQAPPPSSIAVIVQNYSKAGGGGGAGGGTGGLPNRDAFQQLLAEILGPDEGGAGGHEEDVATNYKVLQVVTSAGLTVLLAQDEDPFADSSETLRQAGNSLLVIRLTIQRTPAVLFYSPPVVSAENAQPDQLFLYLWLFPRLFPLLGHYKARPLAKDLVETLEAILFAVGSLPQHWKHLRTVAGYFRGCLNCIASSFQSPTTVKDTLAGIYALELPPSDFSMDGSIRKNLPKFDPRTIRFSLSDTESAALVAVNIFIILARIVAAERRTRHLPGIRSIADHFTAAQQGLAKIWGVMMASWESLPVMREKAEGTCTEILRAVATALDLLAVEAGAQTQGKLDGLYMFAVCCVVDTLKRPVEQMSQIAEQAVAGIVLSLVAVASADGESPLVQELLNDRVFSPALAMVSDEGTWKLLRHDMQVVLLRLILDITQERTVVTKAREALNATTGGEWKCKDAALDKKLRAVPLPVQEEVAVDDGYGPRKRRRLVQDEISTPEELTKSLVRKVYSLLQDGNREAAGDLTGLKSATVDGFGKTSESDRCTTVHTMGLVACASAGDLERTGAEGEYVYRCGFCDSDAPYPRRKRGFVSEAVAQLLDALEAIHKMEKFAESPEIRAWGVETVRRMMNHTQEAAHLNMEISVMGEWCMGLLQSGRRELRIAAGRALPSFLNFSHDADLLSKNKTIILEGLTILSTANDGLTPETTVLAWGQVGRVSVNQELNMVLLRLIEYLGYPNDLVIGAALNELDALVQAHETQPRRLVTPFWRTVSVIAVKQLQTKPQIVQTLIQFISMDLNEFLTHTQAYTLPYLVVQGETDVIQKIAQASGKDRSVQVTCYDNIASILPVLLVQDVTNVEKHAMQQLEAISSEFKTSSLAELVRPDSLMIAAELLKMAGECPLVEQEQKERIHKALKIVFKLSYRPEVHTPATSSRKMKPPPNIDYLVDFFETHVLGLCTLFSDTLKNAQGKSTDMEKIRCLKAIQEMLNLASGSVTSALPQICACCQSALESDALRTTALRTWSIMVVHLDDEDLVPLLSQTFSILLRYWSLFDDEACEIARNMIAQMFQARAPVLEESVALIPSFASIPLLRKFETRLKKWREGVQPQKRLHQLALRCGHENVIVVEYALVELRDCIKENQTFIHTSGGNQQPDSVVTEMIRSLLDVIVTFKDPDLPARPRIERLCTECLGLIGAVNPNIVESSRVKEEMTVLHNFTRADESAAFAMFFLEKIVVKQFLSSQDTKSQGFLAWCAQQLLEFCQATNQINPVPRKSQSTIKSSAQKRWDNLPPAARETLTPFLKSKYSLSGGVQRAPFTYPLFKPGITFREWLMTIITELLCNASGTNAKQIFDACVRICRGQDISISKFLFPVAVLHTAIAGSDADRQNITQEFLAVLRHRCGPYDTTKMKDTLRQCIEVIFSAIDHMTKWLRDKRQDDLISKTAAAKQQNRHYSLEDDSELNPAIRRVRSILDAIPPELMGRRSLEFKSYARSLLYWEQHIRAKRNELREDEMEPLYVQLQRIYTHIDEPDGMAGISAKLPTLDIDQQILEHRKAGKWTAVQSWYELLLAERPGDVKVQADLISSLRDSGQYDALLHQVDGMMATSAQAHTRLLPFAVEASWVTGNWTALDKYLSKSNEHTNGTYDIRMGYALSELRKQNMEAFVEWVNSARETVATTMTESATGSIRQSHHFLVQLHALSELQSVSEGLHRPEFDAGAFTRSLESRLNLMGTYPADKQYILAVRRAALQLSGKNMTDEIMSAWLSTAKLARKNDNTQQAYNAVHHATLLNPALATIEHAKLLWHEGQHKNAIRNLNGAIAKKILEIGTEAPLSLSKSSTRVSTNSNLTVTTESLEAQPQPQQNQRVARAKLLLARWLEASGQTHSTALLQKYTDATLWFQRWEKAHYYLGRHYNKLYEAEKALPPQRQSSTFLSGSHAVHIVRNYMRALAFGARYIFQTMPRLLTVWMDLGDEVKRPLDAVYGTEKYREHIERLRAKQLKDLHKATERYHQTKLGAWMFFTALPQLMSRIIHSHERVYAQIQTIIVKVVMTYPQQSMWSLMAVMKSTSKERSQRGQRVLTQLRESLPKGKIPAGTIDTKLLINEARKLTDQLLDLCNMELSNRLAHLSLKKDFKFRHEVAPCQLVLPTQAVLTVTLPSPTDTIESHGHYAFAANPPTIKRFFDDVHIMASLQKPRKISIEGTDGRVYSFLCKPKDDLRKDARLMEFNNMINRFFKRDAESSRRNLYIRTYSVTPLNEECGVIEWVSNVQTLRDILLFYYKQKNIHINYTTARKLLDEATGDIKDPKTRKPHIFSNTVLPAYPPIFHEWFLEMFSEPAAWFAARLRYTRTSAVMSMTGTVLGLGDRHGENILFDQLSGDTVHVDFNCLFDKGLGFEKPERVPFRLTQNMVDAFGVTGYEGVFRKACESAMRLLRHNEETMMTVLEAFIHDPSVDMVKRTGSSKKAAKAPDLLPSPETPKEILESIQAKLRGLWESDTVPLSVEGHVEVLIKKATDPGNLCAMYIGWCPMF